MHKQTLRINRRKFLKVMGAVGGGVASGWCIGDGDADYWIHAIQVAFTSNIPTTSSTPTIISRQTWGARDVDHTAAEEYGFADSPASNGWYIYPGDLKQIYRTVVIHHSAFYTATQQTMRNLQDLHMDGEHWADIGYHYGIDYRGLIYEGRDIHVRGASVAGHNTGVIGVVLMGNFEKERPPEAQLIALQTLVDWLTATYGLTYLAGHNEFNPDTECPGRHLSLYLDLLARDAGLKRGTTGYVSPLTSKVP